MVGEVQSESECPGAPELSDFVWSELALVTAEEGLVKADSNPQDLQHKQAPYSDPRTA